jgi:hypothetical protein
VEHYKQTNIQVRLTRDDLTSVNVSPVGYHPNFTLTLRDNTSVEVSVAGDTPQATEAFEAMVNHLITAAVKADWVERYVSGNSYVSSEPVVTIAKIRAWMERDEREDVDSTINSIDA